MSTMLRHTTEGNEMMVKVMLVIVKEGQKCLKEITCYFSLNWKMMLFALKQQSIIF